MFSKEQLMAVKTIVTHASCADGMASAMILKHALPQAEELGDVITARFTAARGFQYRDWTRSGG
jgi:hypothetical protein